MDEQYRAALERWRAGCESRCAGYTAGSFLGCLVSGLGVAWHISGGPVWVYLGGLVLALWGCAGWALESDGGYYG